MEKVALVGCNAYDEQQVYNSLIRAFDLLGGIDKFIKKGDRVLLKLNLVMKKHPRDCATTHPVVAQAMATIIKELGATPIFADSPGGLFTEPALRGVYKACGIEEAAKRSGAELNYNTNSFEVQSKEGQRIKNITLAAYIKDVDVIINMPKIKTHGMTLYTGAVKNLFGTVPGLLKAQYHYEHPEVEDFCNALIDICQQVKPTLTIMDAIIGMEGDGPTAGNPKAVGALLAGENPYSLDTLASSLIGINPMDVKTIALAKKREIFSGNIEDVEVLGDRVEEFSTNFKVPDHVKDVDFKGNLPGFVYKIANRILRPKPIFIHNKCIGCRDCEKSCPAKVITMVNQRPRVKLNKCIRCFCCQELCPHRAVEIKRSTILTRLTKK